MKYYIVVFDFGENKVMNLNDTEFLNSQEISGIINTSIEIQGQDEDVALMRFEEISKMEYLQGYINYIKSNYLDDETGKYQKCCDEFDALLEYSY